MMFRSPALRLVIALGLTVTLAACEEEAPETAVEARPVRTITVSTQATGETVSLAGTVESQVQADLGFRISGRVSGQRLIVRRTALQLPQRTHHKIPFMHPRMRDRQLRRFHLQIVVQ